MKTPKEIKLAMQKCSQGQRCKVADELCPYFAQCLLGPGRKQMTADALAYIKQLEESVPRWISVKERMPEPYQHVIVHVRHTEKWRGIAKPEDCWHVVEEDCWLGDGWDCNADEDIHEITHWMPLPEAPKEGLP